MELKTVCDALEKNGFAVRCFATAAEAAEKIAAEVRGKTIGIGGSMTVQELGLYDRLVQENTVYWHWKTPGAETLQKAAAAQVYLLSANAVSATGELVNIDGTGNRIAAALYGHERVIFLVGKNKIAPTLAEAIARARNIAAPKNARRLNRKTPCAQAEPMRCHDCRSPERICNGLAIHARPMGGVRTEVILIEEELGY